MSCISYKRQHACLTEWVSFRKGFLYALPVGWQLVVLWEWTWNVNNYASVALGLVVGKNGTLSPAILAQERERGHPPSISPTRCRRRVGDESGGTLSPVGGLLWSSTGWGYVGTHHRHSGVVRCSANLTCAVSLWRSTRWRSTRCSSFHRAKGLAMAADATDDERAAMADVKAAMGWAGFDVTSMAEDSVAGSLLKHLGVTPTTLPRVIGIFSEDDLAATQYTWKIPDATGERAPSLHCGTPKLSWSYRT